ncbi:MAG TPA: hypothetical protein VFK88_06070 [Gallionella sp.]|nr:hypothetical protein [Gallionella sp.]
MAYQLPESEGENRRLGEAIEWLMRQNSPHDIDQINEAAQRFMLSPLDEDFLIRQFIYHDDSLGQQ